HLPFNRLVDWIDSWAGANPNVPVLLQHGVSRKGTHTTNVAMIPHTELIRAYSGARVLVLQGGAGGIMDARAVGTVPIVVLRPPPFAEVRADHQVNFADLTPHPGLPRVAQTDATPHRPLPRAIESARRPFHTHDQTPGVQEALASLGALPATPSSP